MILPSFSEQRTFNLNRPLTIEEIESLWNSSRNIIAILISTCVRWACSP
jgi:hypothetical protein